MFDLPHIEIAQQFHPIYSIVETQPFNPQIAWVHPLIRDRDLTALYFAENQIEELSEMQADWDGYGALPINAATKYNSITSLRGILIYVPAPEITPNPNGTLSFEWETKRGSAHLEIGQTRLSFYIKPKIGEPAFLDASADDILLNSINVGILVSANLFPLQHGTTSLTTVSPAAHVSPAY
jgi:hypothetical protein